MTNSDVVIIGGGIIGLAMARELVITHPNLRVTVLEKEGDVGLHASGRNSGVLHAGFYYAPESLKARLTRNGNVLLREFLRNAGVPVNECGKVVVTTDESQLPALQELARRGLANGVDVSLIDEHQLSQLEPLARTVETALWSPTTAVSDPRAVIDALRRDVEQRGVTVQLGVEVLAARAGEVTTNIGSIPTGHIVNAAGLYADTVAGWFDMVGSYVMLPFKGLYWYADRGVVALQHHVYPVPDARNPFLGVHATVTASGRVKIGPTAIPALWREDYGGLNNADLRESVQVLRGLASLATSSHHDMPALLRAEVPKYSRRHMVTIAQQLVPSLRQSMFRTKGTPGVRAQLYDTVTKKLEMDFVWRGDEHSTHLLNSVSPAWTSSLAVAQHVVAQMQLR